MSKTVDVNNKESIKNRRGFYLSETEDYSPGDDLSVVLRNCSGGSLVFSTVLYQNKHQTGQGCIPARFQKR